VSVAFPEPDDPAVIVSHGWSLDAVHAHPAVSVTMKAPAPSGTDCVVGDNAYVHAAGAFWVTVSWTVPPGPDTLMRPMRAALDGFAATA
jgi:hypothetical protein